MKILNHLIIISVLGVFFTTTVYSQEIEYISEPKILEVVDDLPAQKEREVMTAVDPMVEIIPDPAPVVVKRAPVYTGCSGENYEEIERCTTRKILEYIGSNFNHEVASETNLTGRQRIITTFIIDSTGKIGEIKANHHHPVLKNEIIRVLESLPQIEAGELENGEKVNVPFKIPIILSLDD